MKIELDITIECNNEGEFTIKAGDMVVRQISEVRELIPALKRLGVSNEKASELLADVIEKFQRMVQDKCDGGAEHH